MQSGGSQQKGAGSQLWPWGTGPVVRGSGSQIKGAGSEIRLDPLPKFNSCLDRENRWNDFS